MGKRAGGGPWWRWIGVFALALSLLCVRVEAAVVRVTPNGAGAKDGSKGKGAWRLWRPWGRCSLRAPRGRGRRGAPSAAA